MVASAITIMPNFVFETWDWVVSVYLCLYETLRWLSLIITRNLVQPGAEMKALGMLWKFSYLFCSDSMILDYASASSVDMEFKEKQRYCVKCWIFLKNIRCSCLCLNDGRCGVFSSLYHKMCWYVMFWFFYNFCNIPLVETISSWIFLYSCVSSNTHFHCFLVQTVWSQS